LQLLERYPSGQAGGLLDLNPPTPPDPSHPRGEKTKSLPAKTLKKNKCLAAQKLKEIKRLSAQNPKGINCPGQRKIKGALPLTPS